MNRTTMTVIKALLFSLWLSLFSGGVTYAYTLPPSNTPVKLSTQTAPLLKELSAGVSSIAKSARKSLVIVSISKTVKGMPGFIDPFDLFGFGHSRQQMPSQKQEGIGSGFIVDLDKGYILTNNHVIEGADEINLKLADEKTYKGKIIGRDSNTDIAVVQITDKNFKKSSKISSLVLGDSDKTNVGSFVVALGAPFGLEASISFGVISALSRGSLSITRVGNFMQTDAAINPGNSGGPLVDVNGKVVGINTAIFSKSGGYNGIGFAVPSNLVRKIASTLINEGSVARGFIGVSFEPLRKEWLSSLKLPKGTAGMIVKEVTPNSPAQKAGIKAYDVIYKIGKKSIKSSEELINCIGLMKPGDQTKVYFYRSGRSKSVRLKVGRWPGSELKLAQSASSQKRNNNDYGLTVVEDKDSNSAITITNVERGSPAHKAGLRRGDIVIGVNESTNLSVKSFYRILSRSKHGVLLMVERHGRRNERFLVKLDPEDK